jgi:hypothetical protein
MTTTRTDFHSTDFTIEIIPTRDTSGKLADVELHFVGGLMTGLKLIGFAIFPPRPGSGKAPNVTFPTRTYSVNGERRSFRLLRPILGDAPGDSALAGQILRAYHLQEKR